MKKIISLITILMLIASTSIVEASGSLPSDMPILRIDGEPIKNSYLDGSRQYWLGSWGTIWDNNGVVNNYDNGGTKITAQGNAKNEGGLYQWRYIDHIDVRIDNASININHFENGVFQGSEAKDAKVLKVNNIVVTKNDNSTVSYTDDMPPREDTVHLLYEYNAQIAPLDDFTNYKSKWLDLSTVKMISINATLRVTNNDNTYKDYDIRYDIVGLENIVKFSDCSNASGVDYYIGGEVMDNVVIIPPPEPELPEIEPLEITLVPSTGDNGPSVGATISVIAAGFILLILNKEK